MSTDDTITTAEEATTGPTLDDLEVVALRKILYTVARGGEELSEETADLGPIEAASAFINRIDELETRIDTLEDDLELIEQEAATALGVANEVDDGARSDGGPSKQKRAELLSRNEVVRRAITGETNGGGVTVKAVKSMARPETELYHKEVTRAWRQLAQKWEPFRVDAPEDKVQMLKADAADLTPELVRVVERDLNRDGLLDQLNAACQPNGGR